MLNIHAEFHLPSNCHTLVIESDSLHCTEALYGCDEKLKLYQKPVITVQIFEYLNNYRPTVLDVII